MSKQTRRILVADDDKFIRNHEQSLFTSSASVVIPVKTAEEALETIKKGGADVMLVDVYMEGMTGPELIALLKQAESKIPVIVMTGDSSLELERHVRELGVFAYFVKPLETQLLVHTVKAAIESAVKHKGLIK